LVRRLLGYIGERTLLPLCRRGSQIILTGSTAAVSAAKETEGGGVPGGLGGGSRLPSGRDGKRKVPDGCEEVCLDERVQLLEERWRELNALPTNSEMFRRLRKFRELQEGVSVEAAEAPVQPVSSDVGGSKMGIQASADACQVSLQRGGQPMSELWHSMLLLNQVETNTEGITRVRIVFPTSVCISLCYL